MIDFLASKITENLVKSSIINEKIPVYRYGIELLISSAIGISLILTLGVISNTFLEATVFLLLFIILRQQTGGYHSNTYVGCNTSFSIIYLILVYIIKHRPVNESIFLVVMLISVIIIFEYSPIDNANKPLSKKQVDRHRMISRVITLIITIATIILYFYNSLLFFTTGYVLVSVASLLVLGRKEDSYATARITP